MKLYTYHSCNNTYVTTINAHINSSALLIFFSEINYAIRRRLTAFQWVDATDTAEVDLRRSPLHIGTYGTRNDVN